MTIIYTSYPNTPTTAQVWNAGATYVGLKIALTNQVISGTVKMTVRRGTGSSVTRVIGARVIGGSLTGTFSAGDILETASETYDYNGMFPQSSNTDVTFTFNGNYSKITGDVAVMLYTVSGSSGSAACNVCQASPVSGSATEISIFGTTWHGAGDLGFTIAMEIPALTYTAVNKSLIFKHNLIQHIRKSRIFKHYITDNIQKIRIFKHNIISHIRFTLIMKHNIMDLVQMTKTFKHQILKLGGVFTRRFKHQIISHIRKSTTLKHQIQLFRPFRHTRRIINLLKDRASISNEGAYEQ